MSLVFKVENGIGWLMFDRPLKRNAITHAMWKQIPSAMDALLATPALQAVVIRGRGDHFSGGADLEDVIAATASGATARTYCEDVSSALYSIATCPVPTVAALDGVAAGAAMGLALTADLRIATSRLSIRLPFVRLGVVPDRLMLDRLVAAVGAAAARRLLLAPAPLDAAACLHLGLVDDVLRVDGLDAGITHHVATVVGTSRFAVARIKEALNRDALATPQVMAADMLASFTDGDVRQRAQKTLDALREKIILPDSGGHTDAAASQDRHKKTTPPTA